MDLERELRKAARLATSPWRMLPDFIIPGEAKCGTSSLYKYLSMHPYVVRADVKEPTNFFKYPGSELQCRMHYPLTATRWLRRAVRRKTITGEASAEYLSKRDVPAEVQRLVPEVKLIILMRNPVLRAFSDYQMLRRFETVKFEQIVDRSLQWLRDPKVELLVESVASQVEHNPVRYVQRGIYLPHIENWLKHFPSANMLFLKSEEFFQEPQRIFKTTCEFLGLPEHTLPEFPIAKRGNYEGKLDPLLVHRLAAFYRPHNERLYEFLGRDFGWELEIDQLIDELSALPA